MNEIHSIPGNQKYELDSQTSQMQINFSLIR